MSSNNIAWEVTYTRCLNKDHQLLFSQGFFFYAFQMQTLYSLDKNGKYLLYSNEQRNLY